MIMALALASLAAVLIPQLILGAQHHQDRQGDALMYQLPVAGQGGTLMPASESTMIRRLKALNCLLHPAYTNYYPSNDNRWGKNRLMIRCHRKLL